MSFLNAKDIEAIRDHLLAIRERTDQVLGLLNMGQVPRHVARANKEPIPDGAWKDDPITQKQIDILSKAKIEIWDQITKGEASKLIEDLFKRAP